MTNKTYYYLVPYTDEVMPCAPTLDGWAAWLSKPDPSWNRTAAAQDGDEFTASTLVSYGQITVDRPDTGRTDTDEGWRISGLVDEWVGEFFLAVPGGWDAEHSGPSVDRALEGLEDDPGPHYLECVAAGEDVILVYRADPPRLEVARVAEA